MEKELSVLQVGVKVMKKILCSVVVFGIACVGVFSRKYHCNMNISFLGVLIVGEADDVATAMCLPVLEHIH